MRILLITSALCALSPIQTFASPLFLVSNQGGFEEGTAARAGLQSALDTWSSFILDDVTVRLSVGMANRGSKSSLAGTGLISKSYAYTAVRDALAARATSAADESAVASLGERLTFRTSEAGDCSRKIDCVAPTKGVSVFDDDDTRDNNYMTVSNALAKGLGLLADTPVSSDSAISYDARITFNSMLNWDFDLIDGQTGYDFVAIAVHELGHALGFTSGVDTADGAIEYGGNLDSSAWGQPLDLFRYSGGVRDWTPGGTDCLSVNGGKSCAAKLATGTENGDGKQASHFKDGSKIGLMDPTLYGTEQGKLTANDLLAFDVIGWTLDPLRGVPTSRVEWVPYQFVSDTQWTGQVPSPPGVALFGAGAATLAAARRRRVH